MNKAVLLSIPLMSVLLVGGWVYLIQRDNQKLISIDGPVARYLTCGDIVAKNTDVSPECINFFQKDLPEIFPIGKKTNDDYWPFEQALSKKALQETYDTVNRKLQASGKERLRPLNMLLGKEGGDANK